MKVLINCLLMYLKDIILVKSAFRSMFAKDPVNTECSNLLTTLEL